MLASVSVIPVPDKRDLTAYTDTVIAVNDLSRALSAGKNQGNRFSQNLFLKESENLQYLNMLYI